MSKHILCLILISLSTKLEAQQFNWVSSYSTSNQENYKRMVLDDNDNIYSIGTINTGYFDFFISKTDSTGNLIWFHQFGSTNFHDDANYIDIDSSGNIYVVGYFNSTVDFDPSSSASFSVTSNGSNDGFILKLNQDGNFIWVYTLGSTNNDNILSLSISVSGYIFIGGYFKGTVDLHNGFTPNNFTSLGSQNEMFVQKRNLDGVPLWTKTTQSIGEENCAHIVNDNIGNLYIIGQFSYLCDFDLNVGSYYLDPTSNVDPGTYILKLNTEGNFVWVKQIEHTSSLDVSAAVLNFDYGLLLTGAFNGTDQDFDPGIDTLNLSSFYETQDCFLMRLDSNGNLNWAISAGNSGSYDNARCVDSDDYGNVIWGGRFYDVVDFDPSPSHFDLGIVTNSSGFIELLDSNGSMIWAIALGSHTSSPDLVADAKFNSNSNIITCGGSSIDCDFDPGPQVETIIYGGNTDAFILNLINQPQEQCQDITTIDSVVECKNYTWINGQTYTTSSHMTDYHTLTSIFGCDSIVHLDLTIKNVDSGITFINPAIYANEVGAYYQWVDCQNNYQELFLDTNQFFIPQNIGSYAVIVNYDGCIDTSICTTISTLAGVEGNSQISQLNVQISYLNDQVSIKVNIPSEIACLIKIHDVQGKIVHEKEHFAEDQFDIPISITQTGIYVLSIWDKNNSSLIYHDKLILR